MSDQSFEAQSQTVQKVAALFDPVIQNLANLALVGKQMHWHVRGATFISVHELLDEIVEHVLDEGLVVYFDEHLRLVVGKGAEPCSLARSEYDCLHK